MVQALCAFLEFCYIARHDVIDTNSLKALAEALDHFHQYRTIFEECGVWVDGFALPRQHSLIHYLALIHVFGALNGLCSSITESKHIKAVKEPWRHSNHCGSDAADQSTSWQACCITRWLHQVRYVARNMLTEYSPCPWQYVFQFMQWNVN